MTGVRSAAILLVGLVAVVAFSAATASTGSNSVPPSLAGKTTVPAAPPLADEEVEEPEEDSATQEGDDPGAVGEPDAEAVADDGASEPDAEAVEDDGDSEVGGGSESPAAPSSQ